MNIFFSPPGTSRFNVSTGEFSSTIYQPPQLISILTPLNLAVKLQRAGRTNRNRLESG